MPARPTYKRRKHRRREVDGKFQYQCNCCRRWLYANHYCKTAGSRWGINSQCSQCRSRKSALEENRKTLVRNRAMGLKIREQLGDAVYREERDVPHRFRHALECRTPALVEAATKVLRRFSEEKHVLEVVGIHARTLRAFIHESDRMMRLSTAEKLAVELDDNELTDEFLPQWNNAGLKRCGSCGSNIHPHWGKGLCRLCYHREYYEADPRLVGRGGWSRFHEKCVGCGTTDRAHSGNGYCTRCNGRIKLHGAPITMRKCACGCDRQFELNDQRRIYFSGSCRHRCYVARQKLRAIRGMAS